MSIMESTLLDCHSFSYRLLANIVLKTVSNTSSAVQCVMCNALMFSACFVTLLIALISLAIEMFDLHWLRLYASQPLNMVTVQFYGALIKASRTNCQSNSSNKNVGETVLEQFSQFRAVG